MQTDRKLQITPVTRYGPPRYPDASDVCARPALLAKLPERWRSKSAVCAAFFATLSLGLSGCDVANAPRAGGLTELSYSGKAVNTKKPAPKKKKLVIPVFSQGEGRGSFGCVSVAPPVFLSEEEAAQVIREEALLSGINFNKSATVKAARLPYTDLFGNWERQGSREKTHSGKIKLDGYDSKKGIGFEFVSVEDVQEWKDPKAEMVMSVETYETKDTAERLADTVTNVAVFYDPMSADYSAFDFDFDWESAGKTDEERNALYSEKFEAACVKYDAEQREKSTEALRAQVRDFLAWLKGQGVV